MTTNLKAGPRISAKKYSDGAELITSIQEFIVPPRISRIYVECVGEGASAGNRNNIAGATSGAGGGAYAASLINVSPGQIFYCTVYEGILPTTVSGTATDGLDGRATIFSSDEGEIVKAAGGKWGASGLNIGLIPGGLGGSITDSIGDIRYAGGNGSQANTSVSRRAGSGGGGAGPSGHGGNGVYQSVGGDGSFDLGGNGGNSAVANNWSCLIGNSYGGGTSGCCLTSLFNYFHARSGAGVIRITWW
jgi:hypothetical protein